MMMWVRIVHRLWVAAWLGLIGCVSQTPEQAPLRQAVQSKTSSQLRAERQALRLQAAWNGSRLHLHDNDSEVCSCSALPRSKESQEWPGFCKDHGGPLQFNAIGECARCGGQTLSWLYLICLECSQNDGDCQVCGAWLEE